MTTRQAILLVLFCITAAASTTFAMLYDRNAAVQYAENWCSEQQNLRNPVYEDYCGKGGDCANFVSQSFIEAFGGAFNWMDGFTQDEWDHIESYGCKRPMYWADQHGCMPYCSHLSNWLIDGLGCASTYCPPFDSLHGQQRFIPGWLRPGDVGVYTWSGGAHFVIVIGFDQNGHPIYADHCGDGGSPPPWGSPHDTHDGDMSLKRPGQGLTLIHIPDVVLGCKHRAQGNSFDSTFSYWDVKHQWVCCWRELPGDSPPWASNPTAYFCLNWEETRGLTRPAAFAAASRIRMFTTKTPRHKVRSRWDGARRLWSVPSAPEYV